ncbi:MAG: MarR family winged helix-turn-helix transcriptional regulator [Streptosporangiaceae bacterium]|jgi:DNA-binding MarR family transcriptional regulator
MVAGRPLGSLAGNAGFLLSRAGTAVQAGFKELLGRWQLRPQQFAILMTLSTAGEASQQKLCQALGIDSGNMVELVDGLEALGYARRGRDPRDRRRYLLSMTAEGQAAFAAMTGAADEYNARFFEPLDQAEQAALVSALAKLFATTPESRRMALRPDPVRTVRDEQDLPVAT